MKKQTIFPFVVSAILAAGCQGSHRSDARDSSVLNDALQKPNYQSGILMKIDSSDLHLANLPQSIHLTMVNNSKDTITTGSVYSIDVLKNVRWEQASPKNMLFTEIAYLLPPGKEKRFEINLLKGQVSYAAGSYRVTKPFLASGATGKQKSDTVFAEFSILSNEQRTGVHK